MARPHFLNPIIHGWILGGFCLAAIVNNAAVNKSV